MRIKNAEDIFGLNWIIMSNCDTYRNLNMIIVTPVNKNFVCSLHFNTTHTINIFIYFTKRTINSYYYLPYTLL